MVRNKYIDSYFRKQLRDRRAGRGWSQEQMAKLLSRKGFPFYATTIAKIEAGDRSVAIGEAAAIAELFEVPLDSLLGRKPRVERDLTYALSALLDAVVKSRTELKVTVRTLRDRLEDIPSEFGGRDKLATSARDALNHLDAARGVLGKLVEQILADIEPQGGQRMPDGRKEKEPTG